GALRCSCCHCVIRVLAGARRGPMAGDVDCDGRVAAVTAGVPDKLVP
ncbi:hypothetical protein G3V80_23870, partial [Escherichia coli]|nr:hypothetical protein [Escherichia coli]